MPPLLFATCTDQFFLGSLFPNQPGAPPPLKSGSRDGGIFKAGWLRKHQVGRPAVAAVLVPRDKAAGDPSSWAQVRLAPEISPRVASRSLGRQCAARI